MRPEQPLWELVSLRLLSGLVRSRLQQVAGRLPEDLHLREHRLQPVQVEVVRRPQVRSRLSAQVLRAGLLLLLAARVLPGEL